MRFVLIDKLIELEVGRRAVARMTFLQDEDVFLDHFPGFAVVPGSLITEAMGQAAGWLLASTLEFTSWPLLTMIDHAKFRRLVVPGDELRITVDLRSARDRDFEVAASASVGDARVADARLLFHAFDFRLPDGDRHRFMAWGREVFRQLGGEDLLGHRVGATV